MECKWRTAAEKREELTGSWSPTLDVVTPFDGINFKAFFFDYGIVGAEDSGDAGKGAAFEGVGGHGSYAAHSDDEDTGFGCRHGW